MTILLKYADNSSQLNQSDIDRVLSPDEREKKLPLMRCTDHDCHVATNEFDTSPHDESLPQAREKSGNAVKIVFTSNTPSSGRRCRGRPTCSSSSMSACSSLPALSPPGDITILLFRWASWRWRLFSFFCPWGCTGDCGSTWSSSRSMQHPVGSWEQASSIGSRLHRVGD